MTGRFKMIKNRIVQIAVLMLAASTSMALSTAPSLAGDQPPATATALSATDITALYEDKTWMWPTGGGYAGPGRKFSAWVEEGGVRTYASGRWLATNSGKLCFEATWGQGKKAKLVTNCFQHVRDDEGNIYQRNLDAGPWYVFKHKEPDAGDEFNKLVAGNKVPQPEAK
jgi:hypothetical protein